jgi:hypothetical protein
MIESAPRERGTPTFAAKARLTNPSVAPTVCKSYEVTHGL